MNLPFIPPQQGVIDNSWGGSPSRCHRYAITKQLPFAKQLKDFESAERKIGQRIAYKGRNKAETEREQMHVKGYAIGFEELVTG